MWVVGVAAMRVCSVVELLTFKALALLTTARVPPGGYRVEHTGVQGQPALPGPHQQEARWAICDPG